MKNEAVQVKKEEPEPLPDLFTKMADDLARLFDAKLTLLKIELREEMQTHIRGVVMIVAGVVVALVGLALLNVAIAFLVSTLFESSSLSQPARYALGFAITAFVYLALGAVTIIVSKNKMAAQGLVPPRTVAELKLDKERIEKEI
jgi:uncharacterized membrane protein YqjE